jgi:hypothetical protein
MTRILTEDKKVRLIRKTDRFDSEVLGDDLVLLHLDSLEAVMLNDTAAIIWEAIDAFESEAVLIDLLREAQPAAADRAGDHVRDFIDEMHNKGFLAVS